MKKICYFAFALIIALSAAAFAACSGGEEASDIYTIADFETEQELIAMNWKNSFGIVSLNTDQKYVKSGGASARLEIHGDPASGAGYTPYAIIYTEDGKYNHRKTDYSDVESFSFSFYNASERETSVRFQFLSSAIYKGGLSSEAAYTLKAGQWTDVTLNIDRGLLSAFMDLSAISEFYFKFENREKEQAPVVLYLDNFVAKTTDEPIGKGEKIRKDNEIESADRAEYLGAWEITANRGASMTLNTDKKFIREGDGSFHFTAEPTGGVNWPEMKLKSNMLTDISAYESIYFWMYNDNPDAYDIVTAGGTKIRTVQPGEWTLMDMNVSWIANVMNFTHTDKEYDVYNFNNFTISLTNNNRKLSFYFDGFYARKAGEGYIGADEAGKAIELSESGVVKTESGKTFRVPSVVNAADYESVHWTVSKTLEAPTYEYLADEALNDAQEFIPADNAGYLIDYKAVAADGKVSRAKVNVIASKDAAAFDMAYGAKDGLDTFTDTLMNGEFKSVRAALDTEETHRLFGENSVKLTFPAIADEAQAAFTWTPGFNINAYDWITFYFYNANDFEYSLISMWGTIIKLQPKAWVVRTVPVAQFNSWVGAAPEIHGGEEFSMSFSTPMIVGTPAADVCFQITTHGYHEVAPVVRLPKYTDVAEKGAEIVVPEPLNANVSWSLSYNGEPVEGTNELKSFIAENYGVYTVSYRKEEGGLTGTAEYTVYVIDPSSVADMALGELGDDPLRDDPTLLIDEKNGFGGKHTLSVTGTKVGPDIGFVWRTGVFNDLDSVTFFVYNRSNGNVNLVYGYGAVAVLAPNTWTALTLSGGQLNDNANGWSEQCNGSQVGRVDGEWVFNFPMNISATTDYDLTFACTMEKGEVPTPTIELAKTTDVCKTGASYAVPAVDGATWEVFFGENRFSEGVTTQGFTCAAAGTYFVKFEKEVGGKKAEATLIVYAADLTKIVEPQNSFAEDTARDDPTAAVETNAFLGKGAVRITGTKMTPDIGVIWKSGVYNDLHSLTFYVYNDSDGSVTFIYGNGGTVSVAPQTWAAVSLSEGQLEQDAGNWNDNCLASQVARKNSEWWFLFTANVGQTTNYDLTIAVAMEKGEVPTPTIELAKTTDVCKTGAAYAVPAVDGATWEVFFGENRLSEGVTTEGFACAAAGTYFVKYEKEVGGKKAEATLIVYAADLTKIVEPQADSFSDDPLRDDPTLSADGDFFGKKAMRVVGDKVGPDVGFVWKSGVTSDVGSLTFYVYNNSDGNVNFISGYGAVANLAPGSWTAVTFSGGQLNDYVNGWKEECNGSQVGRVGGEWVFNFPMNVSGTSRYDLTIAVAMDII